jgi:hypothetical protein
MGILVGADEFARMEQLRPQWRARLREWGLDSEEPIATAVVARSREEVAGMIAAHPESDFLLPESYRGAAGGHTPGNSAGGFFVALAPSVGGRSAAPNQVPHGGGERNALHDIE